MGWRGRFGRALPCEGPARLSGVRRGEVSRRGEVVHGKARRAGGGRWPAEGAVARIRGTAWFAMARRALVGSGQSRRGFRPWPGRPRLAKRRRAKALACLGVVSRHGERCEGSAGPGGHWRCKPRSGFAPGRAVVSRQPVHWRCAGQASSGPPRQCVAWFSWRAKLRRGWLRLARERRGFEARDGDGMTRSGVPWRPRARRWHGEVSRLGLPGPGGACTGSEGNGKVSWHGQVGHGRPCSGVERQGFQEWRGEPWPGEPLARSARPWPAQASSGEVSRHFRDGHGSAHLGTAWRGEPRRGFLACSGVGLGRLAMVRRVLQWRGFKARRGGASHGMDRLAWVRRAAARFRGVVGAWVDEAWFDAARHGERRRRRGEVSRLGAPSRGLAWRAPVGPAQAWMAREGARRGFLARVGEARSGVAGLSADRRGFTAWPS